MRKTTLDQIVDMKQLNSERASSNKLMPNTNPFSNILSEPGPLTNYQGITTTKGVAQKAKISKENPFMSIVTNNTFLDELRRKYGY